MSVAMAKWRTLLAYVPGAHFRDYGQMASPWAYVPGAHVRGYGQMASPWGLMYQGPVAEWRALGAYVPGAYGRGYGQTAMASDCRAVTFPPTSAVTLHKQFLIPG